jgi:uncharacterized protein YdiU (UPF0061 family)
MADNNSHIIIKNKERFYAIMSAISNHGWNLEHTYAELPEIFCRSQNPKPAPTPKMVVFNHSLARSLGLNADKLKDNADIFTGSELPLGAKPIAQAYAGYQFGHFTMLGDGRALLLGEQITPDGKRFDIQLKGSGLTPFSRRGDGYAALSPMLREYIISEAMFHLGVPTTRSLAVALTGREVIREKVLQGAVLTRVAASHIRVGTLDYAAAFGTLEDVRKLADYCIQRHFRELVDSENKYVLFLRKAAELQAYLITKWQLAGFVHGVMNTDNMAISGETIDYGPCAFMDTYDPDTVFSSIDTQGRYSYKNQPLIGAWNLSRFAEALLPLLHENENEAAEQANREIVHYQDCYRKHWLSGMRNKLGIFNDESEDAALFAELLNLMAENKMDYTNTFRSLSVFAVYFTAWHEKWQARLSRQSQSREDASALMKAHNPAVIPRNHRVDEALSAAESGDLSVMNNLLDALSKPYEDSDEFSKPPEPGCCGYRTFCGT